MCCTASPPGELNRDLKPHVADIEEVSNMCFSCRESSTTAQDVTAAVWPNPLSPDQCDGRMCVMCAARFFQVVACYEFYTMEWLQRQVKESAPRRKTSFAQIDTRPL